MSCGSKCGSGACGTKCSSNSDIDYNVVTLSDGLKLDSIDCGSMISIDEGISVQFQNSQLEENDFGVSYNNISSIVFKDDRAEIDNGVGVIYKTRSEIFAVLKEGKIIHIIRTSKDRLKILTSNDSNYTGEFAYDIKTIYEDMEEKCIGRVLYKSNPILPFTILSAYKFNIPEVVISKCNNTIDTLKVHSDILLKVSTMEYKYLAVSDIVFTINGLVYGGLSIKNIETAMDSFIPFDNFNYPNIKFIKDLEAYVCEDKVYRFDNGMTCDGQTGGDSLDTLLTVHLAITDPETHITSEEKYEFLTEQFRDIKPTILWMLEDVETLHFMSKYGVVSITESFIDSIEKELNSLKESDIIIPE